MPEIRIQPVTRVVTNGTETFLVSANPMADTLAGKTPTHWEVWDDNQSPPKFLGRFDTMRKAWNRADKFC